MNATTAKPRIIRDPECRDKTGLSRSTIWRLERKGEFPSRVKLSAKAMGWVDDDIDRWIRDRASKQASDH
jgi:prophage regulatory protein